MFEVVRDYISAPQGFVVRKNYGEAKEQSKNPESQPFTANIAVLNGVDQSWKPASPFLIETGDIIELSFEGGYVSNDYGRFFASEDNNLTVDAGVSKGAFRTKGCNLLLNEEAVLSNTEIPTTGHHKLQAISTINTNILSIGSFGDIRFINLPLYNFKITRQGVVIYSNSLMDRFEKEKQTPEVGQGDLILSAYQESVWREVQRELLEL